MAVSKSIQVYGDVHTTRICIISYCTDDNDPLIRDNIRMYVDAAARNQTHGEQRIQVPKSIRDMKESLTAMQGYDPNEYLMMVVQGYQKPYKDLKEGEVILLRLDDMKTEPKEGYGDKSTQDFVGLCFSKLAIVLFIWLMVIGISRARDAFSANV